MLYLTNGWPLSRARVLIGRSIGKHWRAEFYTYTYTYVSADQFFQLILHYAKSYRPFELFVNENYKL